MIINNDRIEILREHNLLRRAFYPNPPDITYFKDDGTICSTCFQLRNGENGISVDLEHLTKYEISIKDKTKYRLIKINAGAIHDLSLLTEHTPLPDNYAHSLIKGDIDRKISKKLAGIARTVQYPS